jgi:hypothetical protein
MSIPFCWPGISSWSTLRPRRASGARLGGLLLQLLGRLLVYVFKLPFVRARPPAEDVGEGGRHIAEKVGAGHHVGGHDVEVFGHLPPVELFSCRDEHIA